MEGIMREIMSIALFGVLLACAMTVKAEDTTPKHYTCYQTKEPVAINAILDKPIWKKTPALDNWLITVDPKKLHKPATFPTTAWMCWDQDNLYIGFECIDKDIRGSRAKKDSDVWEDDAFELFIDPNGDGKNYVEIEINPLNTILDLLIVTPLENWKESAKFDVKGIVSAVRTYGTLNYKYDDDEKWVGEIMIPWQSFAEAVHNETCSLPPKDGDTWRIGLFRSERGSKIKGTPQEWNSWSPIITNHTPGQFGYVTFSTKKL